MTRRTRLHAFFAGFYLSDKCHKVLTDARGQFVMHLPLAAGVEHTITMPPLSDEFLKGLRESQ